MHFWIRGFACHRAVFGVGGAVTSGIFRGDRDEYAEERYDDK